MELKIFNRELELLGVIDAFTSLIWTRRYYKSGEFELHIPPTDDNIKLLKIENIIYKGGNEAGYIAQRELSLNDNGEEALVVKGFFMTNYLGRRINWTRIIMTGSIENIMRRLVSDNIIKPTDEKRKISSIELGSLNNLAKKTEYQNSFDNIIDCLELLAQEAEYGFGLFFDITNKKLKFNVYEGIDRTINQEVNPPVIFSRTFENIYSQNQTISIENYRNTCLIAGTGEDENRKMTAINETDGLDRYELFVDARDLSDTETVDGVEKEIPWSRYEMLLIQRGSEKLSEYQLSNVFESKVNQTGNFVYKVDFDLGDIVTCHDHLWGITLDTRITEIEEVYEGNKTEINVTFGNNVPTLIDKIKAKMR